MTSPDASAYDKLEAMGAWTAPFLAEHPEAVRELAARFRARAEEASQPAWLSMEGVRGSKSLRRAAEAETRADAALQAELGRLAFAKAREWTGRQAAAALLSPTTVANSAWALFHTIGGLVATKDGFEARKGFFIGKEDAGAGRRRLRPECVVLDEMNRADLDRCIGELYPLLTRSVALVEPARIPGVASIELHERFRIVATVNDASIDDIVFPLSEGLARRFVRIEMQGAREGDVRSYVCEAPGVVEARAAAAASALSDLFRFAVDMKFRFDGGDTTDFRISLGVGYFGPLRSWVAGGQALANATEDAPDFVRARRLVALCLGPARRNPQVRAIQKALTELREGA